jgi:hypothetical protein
MKKHVLTNIFLIVFTFSNAQTISTIAGNGETGFSGDGNAAVAAQVNLLYGMGK